jgi:hypothetical protein
MKNYIFQVACCIKAAAIVNTTAAGMSSERKHGELKDQYHIQQR